MIYIFFLIMLFSNSAEYSDRSENILYEKDGSITIFNTTYPKDSVKIIHEIFNLSDKKFIESLKSQQSGQETFKWKTSKQTFIYASIYSPDNVYSNIAIWDYDEKKFYGLIYRRYNKEYELNRQPYTNITGKERKNYYYKLNKFIKNVR